MSEKRDYQLVSVHFQRGCVYKDPTIIASPLTPDTDPRRAKLLAAADEAEAVFAHPTIELSSPPPYVPSLEGRAKIFPSHSGEMSVEALGAVQSKQIVLIGQVFGMCHASAYWELVSDGAREFHMPADMVTCMPKDPAAAMGSDDEDYGKKQLQAFYGLGRNHIRFTASEDGKIVLDEREKTGVQVRTYVYRTWDDLMKLLANQISSHS